MRRKLFFYARLVISLCLVVVLLTSIDVSKLGRSITHKGWFYLAIIVLVVNLDRILMSYKWNILLRAKGIVFSFFDVVKSYYVGTFWGIFLPGTVGGDVVRAYRVSGQTESTKDIVSSVILERVLGSVAGLLLTIICVALAAILAGVRWSFVIIVVLLFSTCVAVVLFSFHGRAVEWFEKRSLFERVGWMGKLARVYRSYQEYQQHRDAMVRFVFWSLVEQCVPIVCFLFTAKALNVKIPFLGAVLFVPLIVSISKLPISLDGFGIREGLYVYFLSFIGVPHSEAFLVGFLSHILGDLSVLPGYFYCSFVVSSPIMVERSAVH